MTARLCRGSFVICFGRWVGFGRTLPGDLFPEVFLGFVRIAWTRGDAADDARQWRILTRDMRL